jgi:hypothetical protein
MCTQDVLYCRRRRGWCQHRAALELIEQGTMSRDAVAWRGEKSLDSAVSILLQQWQDNKYHVARFDRTQQQCSVSDVIRANVSYNIEVLGRS